MEHSNSQSRFVVCVKNEGCDDLDLRKIYHVVPDDTAAMEGYLRIFDDSGEDYLYPAEYFMTIELQNDVEEALELVPVAGSRA